MNKNIIKLLIFYIIINHCSVVQCQYYVDISLSSGVGVNHTANTFGIGQAWIDVDNDGLLDIYVTNQQGPNHLLMNQGNETFLELAQFESVAVPDQSCAGVSIADFDNDGWDDIYVNCFGQNHLFKNNNGVSFSDITEDSNTDDLNNSQVSAWADINNDGWLDLYVVNYNDGSNAVNDSFFLSNGDFTFTNINTDFDEINLKKPGLAVTFFDYDNDGDQDLYVVSDRLHGNVLWRNDGPAINGCGTHWCFTDVSEITNTNTQVYGMGIATGDIDLDGDLDMYFSSIGEQVLLLNQLSQGTATFVDVSASSVLNVPNTAGWGTLFFDYNNDSYLDAMIATYGQTIETSEKLFKGNGDASFVDVTLDAGISDNIYTEGIAYGDMNNDGLLDLLKGNRNSGYKLYKNSIKTDNNWIDIKLIGGLTINRNAIGSRVEVLLSNGKTLIREVTSGDARGSGNQRILHFGIGTNLINDITIIWSNGYKKIIKNLTMNTRNIVDYVTEITVFDNGFE